MPRDIQRDVKVQDAIAGRFDGANPVSVPYHFRLLTIFGIPVTRFIIALHTHTHTQTDTHARSLHLSRNFILCYSVKKYASVNVQNLKERMRNVNHKDVVHACTKYK